jgi:HAD superfamily hydrolase (TIGR01549 family)
MIIRAVIFDLDGTITRPFLDFDLIRDQMGLDKNDGPVLEAMEKMMPSQRLKAQQILDYHEKQAIEQSQLNDLAKETLSRLHAAGINIGILTRNTKENVSAISRKHGLHFDAAVGREDGPVKPDAFGVNYLCKHFGVKPQETLLVGDYLFDLLCAKAAGAIAVLLTNHEKAGEFTKNADYCIENISQVLDIIENKKLCLIKEK